jgi:hypothetical protein
LVALKPDDKAQNWLLHISASDKLALLYSVAHVLARHQVDVLLAKFTNLGARGRQLSAARRSPAAQQGADCDGDGVVGGFGGIDSPASQQNQWSH